MGTFCDAINITIKIKYTRAMSTEELLNILTYYHLQELSSGRVDEYGGRVEEINSIGYFYDDFNYKLQLNQIASLWVVNPVID